MTKKYKGHAGDRYYIIGITVGEFEYERNYYARFIKSSTIFNKVEEIVTHLKRDDSGNDRENDTDSNRNSPGKNYKASSSAIYC